MATTEKQSGFKAWETEINSALTEHNKRVDRTNICRDYYRGSQWDKPHAEKGITFRHRVVDNIVWANINTIIPSINFKSPRSYVKAKKKPFINDSKQFIDTTAQAMVVESLINYYIRELKLKREADRVLLDASIGFWGVMKIGYSVEVEEVADTKLPVNELIRDKRPFFKRIAPEDFIVDAAAKSPYLDDAEFIGFRWIRKLEDIKKDKSFSNTKELKNNFIIRDTRAEESKNGNSNNSSGSLKMAPDDSELKDGAMARVEGYDIWDKRSGKILTYVKGTNKFLKEVKWPLTYEGFPVELLFFNLDPDRLTPISDVEQTRPIQDEINSIRSLSMEHIANVSQRKYITRTDTLDDEAQQRLSNGGDGTVIEVEGNPNDSILPLRDANISQDMYIMSQQLKRDNQSLNGIPQFEQGIGQKFDTATEPALMAQSAGVRRSQKATTLEEFYTRCVSKLAQVIQQTAEGVEIPLEEGEFNQFKKEVEPDIAEAMNRKIDGEDPLQEKLLTSRLSKIVTAEGNIVLSPWLTVDKEDILGEYEFKIEVGSTRPENQELRKKDMQELVSILQGNPNIDDREATIKILEAYDIKDIDKVMKPAEEVAAEQQAQQEAAGSAELQEREIKSQVDIEKTRMKTESAQEVAAINGKVKILVEQLKQAGITPEVSVEVER
jgi:hypothetical protein